MLSPILHHRQNLSVFLLCWIWFISHIRNVVNGAENLWPLDRPDAMPSIQSLEVMCGKDHMDVHLTFSQPFEGIVSSKGQHGDPRCVYVPPATGQTFFSFRIAYARCGTKPDLHGQFYENTVVVQYDKDLLEVWDEAKRLRCEWFNDYEKTASKPPMVIADLDVIQLDFRGDNVDCWMEIQHGKGPWAPPVSGIVSLGSTLTLVVAINDYRGEFDMRVKSCAASDGGGHIIQLSDEFGCVLRPKMISRFLKARGADERASVITYAFFHAFKFPDALSVHIKCKVEICRHGCLDHCQLQPDHGDTNPDLAHYAHEGALDRKDDQGSQERISSQDLKSQSNDNKPPLDDDPLYDDIIHDESNASQDNSFPAVKMSLKAHLNSENGQSSHINHHSAEQSSSVEDHSPELDITAAMPHKDIFHSSEEKFPHGPRTFDNDISLESRNVPEDKPSTQQSSSIQNDSTPAKNSTLTKQPLDTPKRNRRSVVISDRKVRSADVGVSGLYEVISEADLAFSADTAQEAVSVFQGRIREEVVYGICMPVPGFSILFVVVAVSAVISALVAGSLLYRYQLQKEQIAEQVHQQSSSIPLGVFSNWVGFRLLKMRNSTTPVPINANGGGESSIVRNSCSHINGKSSEK